MTHETYQERVNRYRIERHEELPESHKAIYRAKGIDPDDNWSLIWSFSDEEAARKCLAGCNDDPDKPSFWTYRLVDAGAPSVITRPVWF